MLLRLCRGKSRRKRDFRKVLNRVGTDGATNWLQAKLLAFQFAVLRAKVRGAVAAAYFGMRPVISSPRRNPHTHSPTEKWAAAGSFKVWTRFLGETMGRGCTSRKRARAKERS